MARAVVGDTGSAAPASDAGAASKGWKIVRWPVVAASAAATIAWVSADLLALPREAFVLPYVLAASALTAVFMRAEQIDAIAAARRHPVRALLMTVIIGGLLVRSVYAQSGAPRAHGVRLAFELAWDGVAYGAVDGVLLTVIPIAAVRRTLGKVGWTSDALALLASIAVFIIYHLGFPEFRSVAILAPMVAGVVLGVAYLVSRNPVVPIVAHVAMHVAAVLHGPAGTMQLPPHY